MYIATHPYVSPTGSNWLERINYIERKKNRRFRLSVVKIKIGNITKSTKKSGYAARLISDFFNVFLKMPMAATVIIPMTQ